MALKDRVRKILPGNVAYKGGPVICDYCGQYQADPRALETHVKLQHGKSKSKQAEDLERYEEIVERMEVAPKGARAKARKLAAEGKGPSEIMDALIDEYGLTTTEAKITADAALESWSKQQSTKREKERESEERHASAESFAHYMRSNIPITAIFLVATALVYRFLLSGLSGIGPALILVGMIFLAVSFIMPRR